jgi:small-conductance mechanosensitive channel
MRIWVNVSVAYGTLPERVRAVLLEVAGAAEGLLAEPPPEVRLEKFGDSGLEFALLVWIDDAREDLRVQSRLRVAVAESLEAAGIRIPFPQRDVHLLDRRA